MQQTKVLRAPNVYSEEILVVKRELLLPKGTEWHGFRPGLDSSYMLRIAEHQEFLPRDQMEVDPRYKQIIPYLVFRHRDRYFVMQRKVTASEQRLKNKFSLGIGGHVRKSDVSSTDVVQWTTREFQEEVSYQDKLKITPFGMINDDSDEVGQVHIGLVLLAEGTSDRISIRSELKSGALYTLDEAQDIYPRMESWSQHLYRYLANTTTA